MIKIIINNEELDIDAGVVVTFKKAQQLNGIQNQYSFSNNFQVKDSSKNRRLLGINYLPNSKAKSMTAGYDCDVILNNCIFLKKQHLKIQKESQGNISIYLVFTDSFFMAKAKETLFKTIPFEYSYNQNEGDFLSYNTIYHTDFRSAPISAQDVSSIVVVEEIPALLNIQSVVKNICVTLGYSFVGEFFTDLDLAKYYINPNLGVYEGGSPPNFDDIKTCYQFLLDICQTFNAYIDVSDSGKSVGIYLWKNIDKMKSSFIDYSDKFVKFTDYSFEGGLAKKNTIAYSGSQDFYNSFFENNKSIIESASYLTSTFGAGAMHLFPDVTPSATDTIDLQIAGTKTDAKEFNIYRFEEVSKMTPYYVGGVKHYADLYNVYSPNILEIFNLFHYDYTKNISLPTLANFTFRYDAIFLANFKMQQVFFIKQLSTYWLPLEINFSTKKDQVQVKAIMIEKTRADVPIVFDLNIKMGFFQSYIVENANALYSPANKSPQATFVVKSFDLTKNNVWITGSDRIRTQILSFPFQVDVSTQFILEVDNIDPINQIDSSDLLFQFISVDGGISRVGKINIQHTGFAHRISEFTSDLDVENSFGFDNVPSDTQEFLNYSKLIFASVGVPSVRNIQNSFLPLTGNYNSVSDVDTKFKILQFERSANVTVTLNIGYAKYTCSNRGGSATATTKVSYNIYKNGVFLQTVYSNGVSDSYRSGGGELIETNVIKSATFSVNAGDRISFAENLYLWRHNVLFHNRMDGHVTLKNIYWKFECDEQL